MCVIMRREFELLLEDLHTLLEKTDRYWDSTKIHQEEVIIEDVAVFMIMQF